MHVVQVTYALDALGRDGDALLEAWPTLSHVAAAVARTGARVAVVQAAAGDATVHRDDVIFHFVAVARGREAHGAGAFRVPRGATRLHALVQALQPDVVHIQSLSFPIQTRLLARRMASLPILAQDHASHPPRSWRRLVYRWGLRPLSAVAFTARQQARPFLEAGVLRADIPIFVIVESSSLFTPGDQAGARAATGIGGDPCRLRPDRSVRADGPSEKPDH